MAATNQRHAVLRTAWVYAPHDATLVRTTLRIVNNKPEVNVVADQHGCPTSALDINTTFLGVATRMAAEPGKGDLVGVFHMAARGEAVFAASRAQGGPSAEVKGVTTARRPANSRLDCAKLERTMSRLFNQAKIAG